MTKSLPSVVISGDRIKPLTRRHPWIFSGAIDQVRGNPADGDLIDLVTPHGDFLARAYWNGQSQIRAHVLTWRDEPIDDAWWEAHIVRAIALRASLPIFGDAYRLINAESDGLPGLIVDRYGDFLVVQALTTGIDARKATIAAILNRLMQPKGIYERSDVDMRVKEGLQPVTGVMLGAEPPPLITINENGLHFLVDVRAGHKTGFYLDQRDSRHTFADQFARLPQSAPRVYLNCFAYSGGFSVYGLKVGADRVINVDASRDALALAKQNYALNDLTVNDADFVEGDVFQVLRNYRTDGQQFDGIILDPPKFAQSQKQIDAAARGYKDINLLAFQLIKPGGLLMTFSCSGLIDADLFQKIVFGALVDSGRDAQIVGHPGQAADHPVALTFPEGQYLKGLLCRVW